MADLYIVDTHPLLWYFLADPRLGNQTKQVLQNSTVRLIVPAIALAEALFILERKPMLYQLAVDQLIQKIAADPRITIVALDYATVTKTLECQLITEMHDRQIVATALLAQTPEVQVAILTKDENIATSGLIPVIW